MDRKRVFKTKTFDRWARKVVGDELLCIAAREIEAGLYEADLGHRLCKKRIATPGHGKRGAWYPQQNQLPIPSIAKAWPSWSNSGN